MNPVQHHAGSNLLLLVGHLMSLASVYIIVVCK